MAHQLILILSDFFPADRDRSAPSSEGNLPRLPALEAILNDAHRELLPDGWRRSIAQRFADPRLTALPLAAVSALASMDPPPGAQQRVWFATPVHYFAGIDSLRLHPSGLLSLPLAQQQRLVSEFAHTFEDSPWRLHAAGGRELLLSGPALDADGEDPARFLGADPGAGLPRGAQAATLRRLAVEMEMWLHEHPLNQERIARRELPVSGLWLWGARPGSPVSNQRAEAAQRLGTSHPVPSVRLFGQDSYIGALWKLGGGDEALPEPGSFREMAVESAASSRARAQLVLHPLEDPQGPGAALQRLEAHWLVPALAALRSGELQDFELLLGDSRYRVRRWHLARWRPRRLWRTAAPWWEWLH